MIGLFLTAFVMGGIGTVHCVGMCGPLALSLPVVSNNNTSRFYSTLLYNLGRITTYSLLGALIGMVGSTFAFFGYQQILSISMGVLIIAFLLFPKNKSLNSNMMKRSFERLRLLLGRLFIQKKFSSVYLIGLLNGLLPCGLVYMAMAGAISMESVLKGSAFMAAFGLGTLPLMWSLAYFGSFITIRTRQSLKKIIPILMFGMAVLLIVRGLGLSIPYLSPRAGNHPSAPAQKMIQCHD